MRKNRTLYLIICGLLILNVVAFGLYLFETTKHGETKTSAVSDSEGSVDAAAEDDSAADADNEEDALSDEERYYYHAPDDYSSVELDREPLIAVVDYAGDNADGMKEMLDMVGCASERVDTIENLDIDKYDAIVIPGGNSVTPSMYGAEQQPETKNTDIEKDKLQFEAVRMYADAGKPVLGICRGGQLVNNVFGGTTIQDMPEGWHTEEMTVRIAEGSWLYDVYGPEETTYHFHHQCVDQLGEGLIATQWETENGHIEAYEHKTLPVYGLQWHPEGLRKTGVEVFRKYVEVVKQNMKEQEAKKKGNGLFSSLTDQAE